MDALRNGQTLRFFGVKKPRLEAYFETHPDYAREARPLIATNLVAAERRKGEYGRAKTHFRRGHSLAGARIRTRGNWTIRVSDSHKLRENGSRPLTPEEMQAAKEALQSGQPISAGIGRPLRGEKRKIIISSWIFYHARKADPEFDRLVRSLTVDSNRKAQQLRWSISRARNASAAKRAQANDYQQILAMIPPTFQRAPTSSVEFLRIC